LFWARWRGEQIADACDIGRTVAVGEQAVVADAVEAVRQDVDDSSDAAARAAVSIEEVEVDSGGDPLFGTRGPVRRPSGYGLQPPQDGG
jgi:hypothetical protein